MAKVGVCIGVSACAGERVEVDSVLEFVIKKWFAVIKSYINEKNYNDVLTCPLKISNGNETNILLTPTISKVIAPKDYTVQKKTQG